MVYHPAQQSSRLIVQPSWLYRRRGAIILIPNDLSLPRGASIVNTFKNYPICCGKESVIVGAESYCIQNDLAFVGVEIERIVICRIRVALGGTW